MFKRHYLLLTLVTLLSLPQLTLATSGACSSHNGVNCLIGPGSEGQVICNDGWTGSSVAYMSMTMCTATLTCTSSDLAALREKYNVTEKMNQISIDLNKISYINDTSASILAQKRREITANGGYLSEAELLSMVYTEQEPLNNQSRQLTQEVASLQDYIQLVTPGINEECHQLGLSEMSVHYSPSEHIQPINQPNPTVNTPSVYNCSQTPNSHVFKDGCQCDSGYEWDSSQTQCLAIAPVTNIVNNTQASSNSVTGSKMPIHLMQNVLNISNNIKHTHLTDSVVAIATASSKVNNYSNTPVQLTAESKPATNSTGRHPWYFWLNPMNWF